mgnify:CR=1 FL=1
MNELNTFYMICLIVFSSIGFMLLVREVICWYWKINKTLESFHAANEKLDRITVLLQNIDSNIADEINRRNGTFDQDDVAG